MQMMPSCDQTGTSIHFHSSTTSGSASLMSLRILPRAFPRQSPSPAILFEISSDADWPWLASDFFMFSSWKFQIHPSLPWNLGLDQLSKQRERLLPAEIASLDRNSAGDSFLHNIQLGSAGHLLQRHRSSHLSGQVWVVKLISVANAFVGHQLKVLAAKGMAMTCGEVRERHLVSAA